MYLRRPKEDFVIEALPEETLVYDLKRHKAHCLKRPAALVWEHCDGKTSVRGLAAQLQKEFPTAASETVVYAALHQLKRACLLQEPLTAKDSRLPFSRREVMKQLVRYGLPTVLVLSITSPTTAQAGSVTCCVSQLECPPGTHCSGGPRCASCLTGKCCR
jgi:hypothetical protein